MCRSPPNIATSPEVANKKEHFCSAPFLFSPVCSLLRCYELGHRATVTFAMLTIPSRCSLRIPNSPPTAGDTVLVANKAVHIARTVFCFSPFGCTSLQFQVRKSLTTRDVRNAHYSVTTLLVNP